LVSRLSSAIFFAAFSFLKSGALLVFIGIESPQRSRVLDESRCALRERERVYYGYRNRKKRMAKEFEQSRCCEQLERAFCTVGWRLRSFRKQIRQMRQNKKKKEKEKTNIYRGETEKNLLLRLLL
jgi:hypothetical protein